MVGDDNGDGRWEAVLHNLYALFVIPDTSNTFIQGLDT
jgi:hypothetical protein